MGQPVGGTARLGWAYQLAGWAGPGRFTPLSYQVQLQPKSDLLVGRSKSISLAKLNTISFNPHKKSSIIFQ